VPLNNEYHCDNESFSYLIIKILENKELSISSPFNHLVEKFILNVAYLALGIDFFKLWIILNGYPKQSINMPNDSHFEIMVWMFVFYGTSIVISRFKKRLNCNNKKNDLTI
jgi:hypothetical protein